jgi:hypothetical protein
VTRRRCRRQGVGRQGSPGGSGWRRGEVQGVGPWARIGAEGVAAAAPIWPPAADAGDVDRRRPGRSGRDQPALRQQRRRTIEEGWRAHRPRAQMPRLAGLAGSQASPSRAAGRRQPANRAGRGRRDRQQEQQAAAAGLQGEHPRLEGRTIRREIGVANRPCCCAPCGAPRRARARRAATGRSPEVRRRRQCGPKVQKASTRHWPAAYCPGGGHHHGEKQAGREWGEFHHRHQAGELNGRSQPVAIRQTQSPSP